MKLYRGDCVEIMRAMEPETYTAIVTDPPYGLEFMGKEWDRFRVDDSLTYRNRGEKAGAQGGTYTTSELRPSLVAYGGGKRATTSRCQGCGKRDQFRNPHACPDGTNWRLEIIDPYASPPTSLAFQEWTRIWALEALRVLKPGGILFAFGGTRMFHRLACGLEDAGFEIRDTVSWLYGSGFPKSLALDKAIDARGGQPELAREVAAAIKKARTDRGLGILECDARFCGSTTNWSWFEGRPAGQRIPSDAVFAEIAREWPELAGLAEKVRSAEREVIGFAQSGVAEAFGKDGWNRERTGDPHAVTVPATETAMRWKGYGTALKPAWEGIIVAMKPLAGTFAENALAHGVAGINVDGGRIGVEPMRVTRSDGILISENLAMGGGNTGRIDAGTVTGRWPANVALSHTEGCELLGMRKIPGHKGYPNGPGGIGANTNVKIKGESQEWAKAPHPGHADAEGQETVEQWRCVEDCPVRMLDEQSGQTISPEEVTRGGSDCGVPIAPRRDTPQPYPCFGDTGGASRFFYTSKASGDERHPDRDYSDLGRSNHPTVKPLDLMQWLCRLVKMPSGTRILDPFAGSGSTLIAAAREGIDCDGIEREPEYVAIAAARFKSDAPLFNRLEVVAPADEESSIIPERDIEAEPMDDTPGSVLEESMDHAGARMPDAPIFSAAQTTLDALWGP
jgi:DNA modification methylase